MKAPDHITTPEAYIEHLEEPRQSAIRSLHTAIRKAVPKLKPEICYGMIGYGVKPYRTKSGCAGEAPVIALASQKRHISLYVDCENDQGYLAEGAADRLGKVSVGKSCIRFTKLEHLNLAEAIKLIKKAANP